MEIYEIGGVVKLVDADGKSVSALITGATLRFGNKVEYEVVWWKGSTRNCVWVGEGEIAPTDGSPTEKIGFKPIKQEGQ